MAKNDWIDDAFKQAVGHDEKAEMEAFGRIISEKNDAIMLASSVYAGAIGFFRKA